MELKELVTLYRHWMWLLIVGAILGLAGGYAASKIQIPVYEASAKVLITRSHQQGTSDILSLSDQQLVLTYQQLLKTRPVLDEAGVKLGAEIDPDNVRVDVVLNTQIIQIKVQDKDPSRAAAVANTLIQILIEQNEILQAGRYSIYEESLNMQVAQVQKQIDILQGQITEINETNITEQLNLVNQQIADLRVEITSLEKDIAEFPNTITAANRINLAEKQAQLDQLRSLLQVYQQIQTNLTFIGQPIQGGTGRDDPRITGLQATLNLYQELYLDLLNDLETVKLSRVQSTPTVTEIEAAVVTEKPIKPIPLLYIALAGIVGILIAAGVVLLKDYFDDTLKSSQKIQELLGIAVIGQITKVAHKHDRGGYLANQTGFILANAFGSLRINVSRLIAQHPMKTILITSPALGDGKTTIALNLAVAFVQAGKKTVLLDADFYHPQIHIRTGLDNQKGLSNILADGLDWQEAVRGFGGINVITNGVYCPSSTALLESDHMSQLLKKLQKIADVIIIDGPPLFIVDSQILASQVGGVLLVVRQGDTLTAVARSMLDQLKLIQANLLGVVLNRASRANTYYFDGYYHNIHEDKMQEQLDKIKPN